MSSHHDVQERSPDHDLSSLDSDTNPNTSPAMSTSKRDSGDSQPLPPLPVTRESTTPTQTPAPPRVADVISGIAAAGLGLGTPLPSATTIAQAALAQATHAQAAHMQPMMQQLTDSPTSYFPTAPPGQLASQHPPPVARSNTGASASVAGRPRSIPRTNNTGNGNGNGTQRGSFTTSMEKPGTLDDAPTSPSGRVLDLNGLGRSDDRYSAMQRQVSGRLPVHDERERDRNRERTRDNDHDRGIGMRIGMGDHVRRRIIGDEDSVSVGVPRLPRTVHERLQPTIDHATAEERKYERKAKVTGYALNIAIGLQVLLSAMITALSAVTSGRRTQVMTSILGGAGTIVASYLARARGSNEPELSIARTKDLQRFIRQCDAFIQDHGLETGFEDGDQAGSIDENKHARELDERIRRFRYDLEHLLGNGDGERRLSPPV